MFLSILSYICTSGIFIMCDSGVRQDQIMYAAIFKNGENGENKISKCKQVAPTLVTHSVS